MLLLLTDGLAGDQQEVVRGAYSVVGAEIPLVGGCAGDNLKMVKTLQFHGDDVLTGSVVAELPCAETFMTDAGNALPARLAPSLTELRISMMRHLTIETGFTRSSASLVRSICCRKSRRKPAIVVWCAESPSSMVCGAIRRRSSVTA